MGGQPLTNKIVDVTKNAVDKDWKDEVEDRQDWKPGCYRGSSPGTETEEETEGQTDEGRTCWNTLSTFNLTEGFEGTSVHGTVGLPTETDLKIEQVQGSNINDKKSKKK